jgi:hypothetical protein
MAVRAVQRLQGDKGVVWLSSATTTKMSHGLPVAVALNVLGAAAGRCPAHGRTGTAVRTVMCGTGVTLQEKRVWRPGTPHHRLRRQCHSVAVGASPAELLLGTSPTQRMFISQPGHGPLRTPAARNSRPPDACFCLGCAKIHLTLPYKPNSRALDTPSCLHSFLREIDRLRQQVHP